MSIEVVVKGESDLLQIVLALSPPRRLTCLLYGRQQQRHKHRNNRDHSKQLDQRKAAISTDRPP